MPTAVITGASRGLGRALALALARRGWSLIVDARTPADLATAVAELSRIGSAVGVAGDVTDPDHRRELGELVADLGTVDLLVNNAGTLGPSPLPRLDDADPGAFTRVLEANVVAPLAVYQTVAPQLAAGAMVINVTSDASVKAYPGWGLYGSSKAALDHLSAVLAAERPDLAVFAFDPGDMHTRMHQEAFPGQDISDRPLPEVAIPALLALIDQRPSSGRLSRAQMEGPAS